MFTAYILTASIYVILSVPLYMKSIKMHIKKDQNSNLHIFISAFFIANIDSLFWPFFIFYSDPPWVLKSK